MEQHRFAASLDALSPIRNAVGRAARAAGLDQRAAYRLVLAVDELVSNIVIHGYQENNLAGCIDLTLEHGGDRLAVSLEDDAVPFDPRQLATPDDLYFETPLDQRPVGGLGVMLAFEGVDDLNYQRVGDRNRTVLTVLLAPQSASEA